MSLPTQYNGGDQPPVGALSSALARLQANRVLREMREGVKTFSKAMPANFPQIAAKVRRCGCRPIACVTAQRRGCRPPLAPPAA